MRKKIALLYAAILLEWDLRAIEFFGGVQLCAIAGASVLYDITHGQRFIQEPAFWLFVVLILCVGIFQCSVFLRSTEHVEKKIMSTAMPNMIQVIINEAQKSILRHRFYAVNASAITWICVLSLLVLHYFTRLPRFLEGFSTIWSFCFIFPELLLCIASWAKLNERRQRTILQETVRYAKQDRHARLYRQTLVGDNADSASNRMAVIVANDVLNAQLREQEEAAKATRDKNLEV